MISDVVMPGMDGPTLLKKGRAMLGDARIVFISQVMPKRNFLSFSPKSLM